MKRFHANCWIAAMFFSAVLSAAAQIPKDYELDPETVSPDGRFGVLFPKAGLNADSPPNLLVQLEPYNVLASIEPGVPRGATTDLVARWNGPSMVAIYHFRSWGLTSLRVFELADNRVTRTHDILGAATEILRKDIRERLTKKYPDEEETFVFVSSEGEENPKPEFDFRGRKVVVNLFADNKPNLAPGPHWSALLNATWDLDRGEFTRTRLKKFPITVRSEN